MRHKRILSTGNELNYRTNLLFEETIARLIKHEGISTVYPQESPPYGVAHLRVEGIFCVIGRNGGVQLHIADGLDPRPFLDLIKSEAAYPEGSNPRWEKRSERLSRNFYKAALEALLEMVGPWGIRFSMPPLDGVEPGGLTNEVSSAATYPIPTPPSRMRKGDSP